MTDHLALLVDDSHLNVARSDQGEIDPHAVGLGPDRRLAAKGDLPACDRRQQDQRRRHEQVTHWNHF